MQLDSGAVAEGRITRVTDFGAFIQFENGETGLVHISQIAHSFVKNIHDPVHEGDTIELNAETCELTLHVPEDEIERRRAQWVAPAPRYTRGVLAKYARQVGSAALGAVTD